MIHVTTGQLGFRYGRARKWSGEASKTEKCIEEELPEEMGAMLSDGPHS